jgi:hypothetical protein
MARSILALMPQPIWYDPETNPSQFLDALWRLRHCTRAQALLPHMRVPGSGTLIEAIKTAIDDYAERETATENLSGIAARASAE